MVEENNSWLSEKRKERISMLAWAIVIIGILYGFFAFMNFVDVDAKARQAAYEAERKQQIATEVPVVVFNTASGCTVYRYIDRNDYRDRQLHYMECPDGTKPFNVDK